MHDTCSTILGNSRFDSFSSDTLILCVDISPLHNILHVQIICTVLRECTHEYHHTNCTYKTKQIKDNNDNNNLKESQLEIHPIEPILLALETFTVVIERSAYVCDIQVYHNLGTLIIVL